MLAPAQNRQKTEKKECTKRQRKEENPFLFMYLLSRSAASSVSAEIGGAVLLSASWALRRAY